jgi:hypothetical protein
MKKVSKPNTTSLKNNVVAPPPEGEAEVFINGTEDPIVVPGDTVSVDKAFGILEIRSKGLVTLVVNNGCWKYFRMRVKK